MNYLVPYDFSPISRTALDHALYFTELDGGKIELLHIIKEESQRVMAEVNFTKVTNELTSEAKAKVKTKVKIGDIYKDIANEANDGEFTLLIMGTHGAKGLQKLFGSHAIKVITSSRTPFIVTQSKGPSKNIDRIVLPIDLSKERIQITGLASDLAKKFNAEIHLVHPVENDEFLANRVRNNLTKVKKHLAKHEVSYKIAALEGNETWSKQVEDYSKNMEANLIAIGYHTETLLPQFEKFSQDIITNSLEIPVLILNVDDVTGVKTSYSFVGI